NAEGQVQARRDGTWHNGFVQDTKVTSSGAQEKQNYQFVFSAGQQMAELQAGGTVRVAVLEGNSYATAAANLALARVGQAMQTNRMSKVTGVVGSGSYTVGGGVVTVLEGETLQGLAQRVYGTSTLWYVLADANGLSDPGAELTAGVQLKAPSASVNTNDANTFKPYNPGETIGTTTPSLPYIPPPSSAGCSAAAMLIRVVAVIVAAVVAYYTSDPNATWNTYAAIVGLAGETAAQTVEINQGYRQGYNWGQVAVSALSAGYASSGPFDVAKNPFWATVGNAAVGAASNYITSYAVNKLTGVEDHFSWRQLLAGSATAAVSAGVLGGRGVANGQGTPPPIAFDWKDVAREAVKEVAYSVVRQGIGYEVNKAFHIETSWNWRQVAAGALVDGARAGASAWWPRGVDPEELKRAREDYRALTSEQQSAARRMVVSGFKKDAQQGNIAVKGVGNLKADPYAYESIFDSRYALAAISDDERGRPGDMWQNGGAAINGLMHALNDARYENGQIVGTQMVGGMPVPTSIKINPEMLRAAEQAAENGDRSAQEFLSGINVSLDRGFGDEIHVGGDKPPYRGDLETIVVTVHRQSREAVTEADRHEAEMDLAYQDAGRYSTNTEAVLAAAGGFFVGSWLGVKQLYANATSNSGMAQGLAAEVHEHERQMDNLRVGNPSAVWGGFLAQASTVPLQVVTGRAVPGLVSRTAIGRVAWAGLTGAAGQLPMTVNAPVEQYWSAKFGQVGMGAAFGAGFGSIAEGAPYLLNPIRQAVAPAVGRARSALWTTYGDILERGKAAADTLRSRLSGLSENIEHGVGKESFAVGGGAFRPFTKWEKNIDGVRSAQEALELADKYGVYISDDVKISFIDDEIYDRRFSDLDFSFANYGKIQIDESQWRRQITWRDSVSDKYGVVNVYVRKSVLESDEAIVAVLHHETHEIEGLREIFARKVSLSTR
ncbi:MAG: LysM peptidoglycan-binding domain-containing protein, partial [Anaerolineae bacterium]|nr:LysM peptidoglycan-binding domain-containing protein [Anaerolineae bacterium]